MNTKFDKMSFNEKKFWIQYDFADKAGISIERLNKLAEWWRTVEKDGLETLRKSDRSVDEKMLLTLGVGIEMGKIMAEGITIEAQP